MYIIYITRLGICTVHTVSACKIMTDIYFVHMGLKSLKESLGPRTPCTTSPINFGFYFDDDYGYYSR